MKYKDPITGEYKELFLKASDTLPIGSIVPYGSNDIPANWLLCDGRAVSRTTYANLFSVIGTNFGEGDGTTTFNLPDFRSRVPVGLYSEDIDFDTIGDAGGEKEHTLTIDELPNDSIKLNKLFPVKQRANTTEGFAGNGNFVVYLENSDFFTTQNLGKGQAHSNLQPYQVVNYIIKSAMSVGVIGNVINNKSDSNKDTYSCNYINNAIGKLVWKNTSPNTGFEGRTITLSSDSTEYDLVEIIFKTGTGENDGLMSTGRIPISNAGHYSAIIGGNMYSRDWTISENQLTLSNASRWTSYGADATTNNNGMLPYYIIFYKNNIFRNK